MRSKAVARRLQALGADENGEPSGNNDETAAADSQESGSAPASPSDSATSEPPPTLVHIKQEMPPGQDIKEYYGAIDFALPDTYLPSNYPDYRYLPRELDFQKEKESDSQEKDDSSSKDEFSEYLGRDYNLPSELVLKGGGIFARASISGGTKYGPFIGKWETQPLDRRYAWEVLGKNGIRGWLDGSTEKGNWLKLVRSTNYGPDVNVQHLLLAGQVWYKVTKDVASGQELLLGPRTPLPLQDVLTTPERQNSNVNSSGGSQPLTEEDEREDEQPRCSFCDAPFPNIDALDRHQIQAHGQPASAFHCELCNRTYSSRALLLRHRALAHTDIRKYPCENCPKVFTDPSNLQRHIRAQHVGARSHACPECGKTFATSSGLKQHTHIHSSVKPFQCKVCFKAYTQFSNLCRHKRMHVACRALIECQKCGQTFTSYASLTKHKRFCDTAAAANVNLRGPMPQGLPQIPQLPNVGMNNPNNSNPFSMYRGPTLPHPYNAFAHHYPGLFSAAAAAACPPDFLNPFTRLINVQGANVLASLEHEIALNTNLAKQQEGRMSVKSIDSATSVDDLKKKESEFENNKRDTDSVDRNTPKSQNLYVKSPPLSDDINQRPLPVMPMTTPIVSFNFPRDELKRKSPFNFSLKNNNNDIQARKSVSPAPKDLSKSIKEVDKNSEYSDNEEEQKKDQGDQPLDLSVSRKQSDKESEMENDDHSFRNSSVKSYSPPESPVGRESKTPENETTDVDVEAVEPKREDSPPMLVSQPLAFPMPVHPQHNNSLIDAMYRGPRFPSFHTASDAILNSSHSPYVPSPFNFLSPLLGTDGPDRQQFAKFRELSAGTGKLRDRYACKFCGKVFPRSANLTRHLRTHTGEQPYKCKYCERSFSISSNLQRHVRNIHNKERPFRCPLCDRCFGQQTNLDRHLKKHEAEGGDSPSSADTEREDAYFDDIRSFMGKVTCSPGARSPPAASPHGAHAAQHATRPSALAITT
ncbi:histone-lysine N-methyltransferase PRDM16-like isoform X2 [Pectinophora gossypiella]|uniref:histone-lysine N-methyltransferase PRDM16-like isoform X2 n=1 Tax=Pectinophora gossypiella TaxID=13191 RepID=UPI00214E61E7|nr:histone-lysine N-methyltransferase PRDM16-like isoform X2 [Pectinophora gossypiella]